MTWYAARANGTPTLLALLVLVLHGCAGGGSTDDGDRPLLVMAAASLNATMTELIERFEATSGTPIDLVLGSTGGLAAQIEHGAPADIFFSADEATVERLVESGALREGSVVTYAVGELVLTWRDGLPPPASVESLTGDEYEAIAIANPEHAPYGTAAREALQRSGSWSALESRIIQGENVAQTHQFVQTGNADAAIVARSLVEPAGADFIPIDGSLHEPIRHAAGVLARSAHPAAGIFLDFVMSDTGQSILAEHGFAAPPS